MRKLALAILIGAAHFASYGQVIMPGRGGGSVAGVTGTNNVYINPDGPSYGSSLSNVLWNLPNGSTLYLGPGTYTNNTLLGETSDMVGPLQLRGKTNITIIGAGQQATRIFSSVTNLSNMLILSNTANIKIYGITFEGTRYSDPQPAPRFVNACAINICGSNKGLVIDSCSFKNWMGQGLFDFGDNGNQARTNSFFTIINNYTYNLGTTNGGTGNRDGVAWGVYPNSIYSDNVIENSVRGFEWEAAKSDNKGNGTIIKGNIMKNVWDCGIYVVGDAQGTGSSTTFYEDLIISDNQISMTNIVAGTPTFVTGMNAITISGGGNINVVNNQIYGCNNGIALGPSGTNVDRIIITENTISWCFTPMSIEASGFNQRYILINNNSFDNCLDRIDVQASNITFKNNQFVNCGTGNVNVGFRFFGGTGVQLATNIIFTGNNMRCDVGTCTVGIVVNVPVRNFVCKDNIFGVGITKPITFEADGEIDLTIDAQTTSATPVTFLTLNMMTNSGAFFRMDAIGVSTTSFDTADLSLAATFRNTNGFVSNIVASAVHTFLYTNRTDATWYIDVTNAGTKVINFVASGAAGKTVNWRARCRGLLIGN